MILIDISSLYAGKVIPCPQCKGLGQYYIEQGYPTYGSVPVKCGECKGKRLVKIRLVPIEDEQKS